MPTKNQFTIKYYDDLKSESATEVVGVTCLQLPPCFETVCVYFMSHRGIAIKSLSTGSP
jgi:hypothetical protein